MKRRLAVIVLLAGSLAGGTSAAQALTGLASASSHWGCVGVAAADLGACFSNPLPERLPIPATPSTPS